MNTMNTPPASSFEGSPGAVSFNTETIEQVAAAALSLAVDFPLTTTNGNKSSFYDQGNGYKYPAFSTEETATS